MVVGLFWLIAISAASLNSIQVLVAARTDRPGSTGPTSPPGSTGPSFSPGSTGPSISPGITGPTYLGSTTTGPPEYCVMVTDIPPDTVAWKELDSTPGFTAGDQPVNPGDKLQPNDIVKIGACVECICRSQKGLDCHDVPNTWTDETDQCITHTCVQGNFETENKAESCKDSCREGERVESRPYPECCACVPVFCTMTNNIPPGQPVWIERDNKTGPTEGDKIITSGDPVEPDEKVQLGYCQECVCEPGKALLCYSIPNTWVSPEEPCFVHSCFGNPINKSASCNCPAGSELTLALPEDCCGCLPAVSDKCIVAEDDLMFFETAWTENNPDVQPGYELNPGEILHAGECKECLCTSSGVLSCSAVKTPLQSDDPCVIIHCTPKYEYNPFFVADSCVCKQDEKLVYAPAPVCCECVPNEDRG